MNIWTNIALALVIYTVLCRSVALDISSTKVLEENANYKERKSHHTMKRDLPQWKTQLYGNPFYSKIVQAYRDTFKMKFTLFRDLLIRIGKNKPKYKEQHKHPKTKVRVITSLR